MSKILGKDPVNIDELYDSLFPVGYIYLSVSDADPGTLFGGTWERIQDTFLLAAGSTYAAGKTGGEAEHTLVENEIPSHNHTLKITTYAAELWTTATRFVNGSASKIVSYGTGEKGISISNVGGGKAHNNMPPYLSVYIWKRTA